ncbi:pyruvate formate lyase-activating protein [Candidatus Geothermarchaeota archaeon]|nr:MAG: pyruvate formate lyase-activating protein [Candidatus Geothermarchaeota archaeon]
MVDEDVYYYLVRPDSLTVWGDENVRRILTWYYRVMKQIYPPRYIIAKHIEVPRDIRDWRSFSADELFNLHRELRRSFRDVWNKVYNGDIDVNEFRREYSSNNFLEVKIEIAKRLVNPCRLCERRCMVNRYDGHRGVCGLDSVSRVASAFLHMGEEAPLVPSGTIFFTGCSFKCVFCQNWDISQRPFNGEIVDPQYLARISHILASKGARNINYVGGNPDQNLHVIIESLRYFNDWIPLLWNSNMYMTIEALELLLDIMDIWLPDFKYGNNECGFKLSRVHNYYNVVTRNLKIVYGYGGEIIIRHLVLPNHIECCTKPVLRWIADNTPNVLVNIMDQYRPEHMVVREPWRFKDIARRPKYKEMEEAYSYADKLGIIYRPIS